MFSFRYFYYTKVKAQLANAITLINLSFGAIAIILISKDLSHMSLVFIFLAALFDRFDGMTARHFHTESSFGKELDSLSDIISFGIAPALLIYHSALSEMLWVGIAATIIYIASGAVRLARYNVEEFDGSFRGVPITAAGVILTVLYFAIPYVGAPYLVMAMLFLSYAMVSNFRIAKV
ncbi:CDP-diacylglycerol--serine O-phosphatidyltransferase [Sporosarcina sp. NCCP-2716]|uniref:CDP-diacylglycerol--serine O-phosphatidyltransferase n=1 Tax=Sporosarcina sp. NCCP-2716 TaxID=2943679 RepID=UPI00204024DF|nr:CDP-diacylglycerol--serine O-phosphatidyltransferase [Sporosarcina sp. NCCP-2716]GKV69619.1 CDP-diacylglycerol--serine O-phosphatidyltransferase [Sporosarcina sp. NCCP-2716]